MDAIVVVVVVVVVVVFKDELELVRREYEDSKLFQGEGTLSEMSLCLDRSDNCMRRSWSVLCSSFAVIIGCYGVWEVDEEMGRWKWKTSMVMRIDEDGRAIHTNLRWTRCWRRAQTQSGPE